jgi:site-specific DNA-methyltransferase (adenine-specific)
MEKVQIGECTLYCGDALAVLPELEDIGAVIADPPYSSGGAFRSDRAASTSIKYNGWSQREDGHSKPPEADYPEFTGDNKDQRAYLHWSSLWLSLALRAAQPGAIILTFTDWRQLPITTDAIQGGGWIWRGIVVWDKGVGRPMKGRFRNHIEYVCWGSNGTMLEPDAVYPSSVFRVTPPTSHTRQHRTEKPVELLKQLMAVVPQGARVLDPFMGSGTTALACVQSGRPFVGVELSRQYFDIACKRIEKAYADSPLLAGVA